MQNVVIVVVIAFAAFAAIGGGLDLYMRLMARNRWNAIRRNEPCRVIGSMVGGFRIKSGLPLLRRWMMKRDARRLRAKLALIAKINRVRESAVKRRSVIGQTITRTKWEPCPLLTLREEVDLPMTSSIDQQWENTWRERIAANPTEMARRRKLTRFY